MAKKKINHTTLRSGKLLCLHCGGEYKLQFPMPIEGMDSMNMKIKNFNDLHGNCKPGGWKEPEADQSKSEKEKAEFWMTHGERGSSSETIWGRMMGIRIVQREDHPYDPSDFNRCHKLLEMVPEWRAKMHVMKEVSPVWEKLVDNWDRLTELLVTIPFKKGPGGLYEEMQKLIR